MKRLLTTNCAQEESIARTLDRPRIRFSGQAGESEEMAIRKSMTVLRSFFWCIRYLHARGSTSMPLSDSLMGVQRRLFTDFLAGALPYLDFLSGDQLYSLPPNVISDCDTAKTCPSSGWLRTLTYRLVHDGNNILDSQAAVALLTSRLSTHG